MSQPKNCLKEELMARHAPSFLPPRPRHLSPSLLRPRRTRFTCASLPLTGPLSLEHQAAARLRSLGRDREFLSDWPLASSVTVPSLITLDMGSSCTIFVQILGERLLDEGAPSLMTTRDSSRVVQELGTSCAVEYMHAASFRRPCGAPALFDSGRPSWQRRTGFRKR
jgi:hypothetical protein